MSDTPPVGSFWKRQLLAFSSRSSEKLDGTIALFKKIADYLVTLLRLFAVVTVSLILTFIVLEVWHSSNLVVVKPFTLPKKMQDLNPDGGRIIANQLSRAMKNAENRLYCTIKVGDDNGQRCSPGSGNLQSIISRDSDSFLVGGNIKLPETGISISDVVEFISRIFGRRNIIGSVYEDNGELFLQVELDGTVFKTSRLLDCSQALAPSVARGCDPAAQAVTDGGKKREGELNYDLINDMLEESSIAMLSTASGNHNLFYFCAGQTDVDAHRNDADVSEWFQYCASLRDSQLGGDELGSMLHKLEEKAQNPGKENDLITSIRELIYNNALAKTEVLCPDYLTSKNCVLPKVAKAEPAVMQSTAASLSVPPVPVAAIAAAPPASDATGEGGTAGTDGEYPAAQPEVPPAVIASAKPASTNLTEVTRQWESCVGANGGIPRPPATSRETLDSNSAENLGTQAYNSGLYQQALDGYTRALDINCRNVFAWANIGVLFTQQKDAEAAVYALERSVTLRPDIDWTQNSLCIARAYTLPLDKMEQGLFDESCKSARDVNPLNKVVLDKRFNLAVANRYADENRYEEALATYRKVLSVDNKLDCNTRDVLAGLQALGEKYGKAKETGDAICDLKNQANPLPGGKLSQCNADLEKFCNQSGGQ